MISWKQKFIAILVFSLGVLPAWTPLQAQTPPVSDNGSGNESLVSAGAYVIIDNQTKQIIAAANGNQAWTPASLTKLVTALVVLDTKPNLKKSVAITAADQRIGACGKGGACIRAAAGVKFTIDGLFHAALLPSANNAANALARSTGLTSAQFAKKMNAKAKSLGAKNSKFNEPTGMDAKNTITAADYALIISAAFTNPYLLAMAQQHTYSLNSTNNSRYNQTIKNTDKLLNSDGMQMRGAKTGYLGNTYNLASIFRYQNGPELVVVLLGEPHLYTAFADTLTLAGLVNSIQKVATADSTID
jgi:D-alanyl-D-alanine endopeptidase (penicillin-binding protein 7)